jgi:hypothetical protein
MADENQAGLKMGECENKMMLDNIGAVLKQEK